MAFMSWGLDLYDLKVIANNSIQYSLIDEETKKIGYKKFDLTWNKFIDEVYHQVCLKSENYIQVTISNILPTFSQSFKQIEISVFGKGFETAVCKKVWCLFRSVRTEAYLSGISLIKCRNPVLNLNKTEEFDFKIQIDDFIYATNFNFTIFY